MTNERAYLEKIIQLLDDPDNEILSSEVLFYRKSSHEHQEYYQQILQIWNQSAHLASLDKISIEDAADRLSAKLDYKPNTVQVRNYKWLGGIAATILISISFYWVYSATSPVMLTKKTGTAIDSVILSDKSIIYLAANTTLIYPEEFDDNVREVILQKGEAFFEIARDRSHPFSVQIDSAHVTVLGTSFNIQNEEDYLEISVVSGKVKFNPTSNSGDFILKAGNGITYNRLSRSSERFDSSNLNCSSWFSNELVFVDAPLPEVFSCLEKHFKIKMIQKDSFKSFQKFNASFKDNSLLEVLEIIEATYPIVISREAGSIVLQSK